MSATKGIVLRRVEVLGSALQSAQVGADGIPEEVWDAYQALREAVERNES